MVFVNQTDRSTYPLRTRLRSILIATPVMIVAGGVIVSAKLAPIALVVLVLTLAVSAFLRGSLVHDLKALPRGGAISSCLLFTAYVAASALWAQSSLPALEAASRLLAALIVVLACQALVRDETRQNILHMSEGIWIGLLVVCVLFAVDAMTRQALKIFIYNSVGMRPGDLKPESWHIWKDGKLVWIYSTDLTRNAFGMPLLMWPALLGIAGIMDGRARIVIRLLLMVVVAVAVFQSTSETAKIAICVGTIVFAISHLSLKAANVTTAVAILVACLATIPLVRGMNAAGLSNALWLPASARSRVAIWNHTIDRTLERPILGVGAGMTYQMHRESLPPQVDKPDWSWIKDQNRSPPQTLSLHAHNIFVQTWFELGAVGAVLLATTCVFLVSAVGRMERAAARHGLALLATSLVLAASSYGMWQHWFIAMFALSVGLFAVAARSLATAPRALGERRA